MNHASDPFGGLPHFAERAQAGFEPTLSVREEANLARYEEDAVATLQTMLALEEQGGAPRKDEDGEHSQEFLRLERKLDIVIALLATRASGEAASEHDVQFSAEGARWAMPAGSIPKVGTPGLVKLWLHRALPRPLVLPGEAMADGDGWFRAGFLHLGPACEDLLVRYVFLQHRRRVAGARRWVKRAARA